MTTPSISEFLKSPQTELTSVYGHLVNIFLIQNDLIRNPLIYCAFNDPLKRMVLSFRFNSDTLEVQDVIYKSNDTQIVAVLSDEDKSLLKETLPIHFERVGVVVRKITKEMRSDWGREYKAQVLDANNYTDYMSRAAEDIEKHCKCNIIYHTLETLNKKRTQAFPTR